MSAPRIDPGSVPDTLLKAEDFLCDDAYQAAPLGGMNEFSQDCTAVMNMPPCPCPECGGRNRMVGLWAYPQRIPSLILQGYRPVPLEATANGFNGGKPVTPVDIHWAKKDGLIVREPGMCEVALLWTTCMNDRRLKQNEAYAAQERMLGQQVRGRGVIDGEVTQGDAAFRKNNIAPFEEQELISETRMADGTISRRPLVAQLPPS